VSKLCMLLISEFKQGPFPLALSSPPRLPNKPHPHLVPLHPIVSPHLTDSRSCAEASRVVYVIVGGRGGGCGWWRWSAESLVRHRGWRRWLPSTEHHRGWRGGRPSCISSWLADVAGRDRASGDPCHGFRPSVSILSGIKANET
jgi:hypothetical protein